MAAANALNNLARAAVGIGAGVSLFQSSIYNVDGGFRAVMFDRLRGVQVHATPTGLLPDPLHGLPATTRRVLSARVCAGRAPAAPKHRAGEAERDPRHRRFPHLLPSSPLSTACRIVVLAEKREGRGHALPHSVAADSAHL